MSPTGKSFRFVRACARSGNESACQVEFELMCNVWSSAPMWGLSDLMCNVWSSGRRGAHPGLCVTCGRPRPGGPIWAYV